MPIRRQRDRSTASRKTWFCVLLGLLLLNNPFLTITTSSHGLSIQHPPSFRATVAASELQHFSPVDGQAFAAPELGTFSPLLLQPDREVYSAVSPTVALPRVISDFSASLWFRPPPIV